MIAFSCKYQGKNLKKWDGISNNLNYVLSFNVTLKQKGWKVNGIGMFKDELIKEEEEE